MIYPIVLMPLSSAEAMPFGRKCSAAKYRIKGMLRAGDIGLFRTARHPDAAGNLAIHASRHAAAPDQEPRPADQAQP